MQTILELNCICICIFFANISTIAKFITNDIIAIVIVSTIISCIIHKGGI